MGQVENYALSLANVSKAYGRVRALENLSFNVAEGRFFVLFGPSSVGKTTTLRTIAGLVTPDRGRVEIFGKDWTNQPIAGRGVSMVFQSFALYPHLTVYQNFAYPLVEEKVAKSEIDRRVRETAAMLRLDKKIDRKPNTLSGGEQQRVALGRSLIRRPKRCPRKDSSQKSCAIRMPTVATDSSSASSVQMPASVSSRATSQKYRRLVGPYWRRYTGSSTAMKAL